MASKRDKNRNLVHELMSRNTASDNVWEFSTSNYQKCYKKIWGVAVKLRSCVLTLVNAAEDLSNDNSVDCGLGFNEECFWTTYEHFFSTWLETDTKALRVGKKRKLLVL